MTTSSIAIRPARTNRVNRMVLAGLLLVAGFLAGLGAARLIPPDTLPADRAVTTQVAPGFGGLSPDARDELRGSSGAFGGLSPEERDELSADRPD